MSTLGDKTHRGESYTSFNQNKFNTWMDSRRHNWDAVKNIEQYSATMSVSIPTNDAVTRYKYFII